MSITTMYWRFAKFARCFKILGVSQYITYHNPWGRQTVKLKMLGVEIEIRKKTPDLYVALSSLSKEFDLFETLLPQDFNGVLIDAGGYIGTAAIKMSLMYPQATVLSIEPSSENFEFVSKNIAPYPNITVVNAALSSKGVERINLLNRGTGQWGLTIVENPADLTQATVIEKVEVLTLGGIRKMYPDKEIGAIKLDIEGAEKELFLEESEDLKRIPIVFAELHDRIVSGCSDAFYQFSKDRWVISAEGEKYLSLKR